MRIRQGPGDAGQLAERAVRRGEFLYNRKRKVNLGFKRVGDIRQVASSSLHELAALAVDEVSYLQLLYLMILTYSLLYLEAN